MNDQTRNNDLKFLLVLLTFIVIILGSLKLYDPKDEKIAKFGSTIYKKVIK